MEILTKHVKHICIVDMKTFCNDCCKTDPIVSTIVVGRGAFESAIYMGRGSGP